MSHRFLAKVNFLIKERLPTSHDVRISSVAGYVLGSGRYK
jgi:hypothetical protein